jgi:hypothetical protein
MKDGYVPLINVGSISRFLENALDPYALDLVSPHTGMLPPEIPGKCKRPAIAVGCLFILRSWC